MQLEKTEGIVLRSLTYQEDARILTLFTKDLGLISLMLKGVSPRSLQKMAAASPFCQAEFVYFKGQSDMLHYRDSTLLNEHLFLRNKLSSLQTAGSLVQALLKSQMPGKSSPALYYLLDTYLKQIPAFVDPLPLLTSFYLKILSHEGVLLLSDLAASPQEQELLEELLFARSFEKLKTITLPATLTEKAALYFQSTLWVAL